jgi:outer membrane lipoprotein SlyB
MRQYRKLLPLAAVVGVTALSGCASRQPTVVVVPNQAMPAAQATNAVRSGTVIAARNLDTMAGSSQGSSSSGATAGADASSAGQLLTIQFEDGKREMFQVAAGGVQFQVGERVTVNTALGTALITR